MGTEAPRRDRWRARPILGGGLRLAILAVPAAVSFAVTLVMRSRLPVQRGAAGHAAVIVALVAIAACVAFAVERLGRRLLPLVMLLKLSMLFPDRAPSRFAVAREAGSARQLRRRLAELDGAEVSPESSSAATILALTAALQSHDRRTRGHAERVRIYTDMLAEELRLPDEDRDRLRWAALLHDIGKLSVRARTLNKPGKLDSREWEEIKRHPLEGERIAEPLLAWLGEWGDAIAHHHERFDGEGYPNRLAGEGISYAGRIVAVADAYDTMTAARTYKRPMATRAARQELARCAGGQFDPVMVRAFFSISLPRLVWKTGPLSFLVQLPFLARLQEVGVQTLANVGQVAAAAAAAAAVGAAVATGPHPATSAAPAPRPPAVVAPSAAPNPQTTPTAASSPAPSGSRPSPTPSSRPTSDPSPTPSPTSDVLPTVSPTPLPLPSTSPLPLPLPTDLLPSILKRLLP
ncbi:MAG: HD domain-containing protein [Actinobacteria bacterium]|nr:MAG: HD domain-containing protein [Actinomycetota bacterium]